MCAHLRQVVDVCVAGSLQSIDRPSEGVDLLVRVSHQDLPTALGQQHVHDGCHGNGETHDDKHT